MESCAEESSAHFQSCLKEWVTHTTYENYNRGIWSSTIENHFMEIYFRKGSDYTIERKKKWLFYKPKSDWIYFGLLSPMNWIMGAHISGTLAFLCSNNNRHSEAAEPRDEELQTWLMLGILDRHHLRLLHEVDSEKSGRIYDDNLCKLTRCLVTEYANIYICFFFLNPEEGNKKNNSSAAEIAIRELITFSYFIPGQDSRFSFP